MPKVLRTKNIEGKIIWAVTCLNKADEEAALKLDYELQKGMLLSGERAVFAFASRIREDVEEAQDEINKESNRIVMPKGSDPIARGSLIRRTKIYRRN